ncbi:hypothetical protein C1645_818706 [Glomus cerebriforme]|uniref:Uncharacterized protein n=1 Tax=Glomus cerebriforme TaxID=658196 RepID=A0A397TBY7_9GLOM|nr:hypothetical protein C1645_818706 [Glomus cerebriforme]
MKNNRIRVRSRSTNEDLYEERISRLENGMINMQEQMKIGFNHILAEIRALSSFVQPQISQRDELIENQLNKRTIKGHNHEYESDEESVVEINPEYGDSYLEDDDDEQLANIAAQKQFVKEHRKQIRNEIKILLRSAKFDKFPIDYTKKFSVIAPQLERELIPNIHKILKQRGFNVTLKIIRDILSDYHKNGRRKLKTQQLDDIQKKQKKVIGHITNRLSEKKERRSKGALSMVDNPIYREWLEEFGLEDVNEILSKNDYQSPEESDPENDPNAPMELESTQEQEVQQTSSSSSKAHGNVPSANSMNNDEDGRIGNCNIFVVNFREIQNNLVELR